MIHNSKTSLRIPILVAITLFGFYAVVVYWPNWAETTRSILSNGFNVILALVATIALYQASRVPEASQRVTWSWRLLALAFFVYAIGNALWMYIADFLHQDPYPSISDFAYLTYYPLCIGGLLLLPTQRRTVLEKLKAALDLGVVAVASVLVYWVLLISPIYTLNVATADWQTLAVTIAYPALDLIVVWCVGLVLLRQQDLRSLGLLILAMFSFAIADGILNYQMIDETFASGSSVSDFFYIGAYLFAFLGGVAHIVEVRKRETAKDMHDINTAHAMSGVAQPWRRLVFALPYLWLGLAYGLLIHEETQSLQLLESTFTAEVTLGIGIILGLVLIRQLLTFAEKESLSAQLNQLLVASQAMATNRQTQNLVTLIPSQLTGLIDCEQAMLLFQKDRKVLTRVIVRKAYPVEVAEITLTESLLDELKSYPNSANPRHRDQMLASKIYNQTSLTDILTNAMLKWTTAPLVVKEQILGFIAVGRLKSLSWQQVDLLNVYANHASAMLSTSQFAEQEAQIAVSQAATQERSRIARELHDSVSQALFGIVMGTQTARDLLPPELTKVKGALEFVSRLTEGALAEMRALVFQLHPETLSKEGLLRALQQQVDLLTRRHEIDANITAGSEPQVSLEVKETLYRIAIEAVQNSIKHARAKRVNIVLTNEANDHHGNVRLEVSDNGYGLNTHEQFSGHLGLVSMRERAERFGGRVEIESIVGHGTSVKVIIPAQKA